MNNHKEWLHVRLFVIASRAEDASLFILIKHHLSLGCGVLYLSSGMVSKLNCEVINRTLVSKPI
jgi:hypothetical protein